VVTATGAQWAWTLSRDEVPLGKEVEFQITSSDVNHGFGIYDSQMRLLAQTQAMPGYVNRIRHTFNQPGTYQVLCLEYCGLVHHEMVARFVVK
jgi:cytochrome c oxidase subunit 2